MENVTIKKLWPVGAQIIFIHSDFTEKVEGSTIPKQLKGTIEDRQPMAEDVLYLVTEHSTGQCLQILLDNILKFIKDGNEKK